MKDMVGIELGVGMHVFYFHHGKNAGYVHEEAEGCVNDLCQSKKKIILKLRTADICDLCIKKIQETLYRFKRK